MISQENSFVIKFPQFRCFDRFRLTACYSTGKSYEKQGENGRFLGAIRKVEICLKIPGFKKKFSWFFTIYLSFVVGNFEIFRKIG